jgi:hypothetical protein
LRNEQYAEVPKKVKTLTGKDKERLENKIENFKNEHFVCDIKRCTDTMALVFYFD